MAEQSKNNRRKICQGIFVVQEKEVAGEDIIVTYKLDVERMSIVEFSADFSNSLRVVLEGAGGGLFKQTQVEPFSRGVAVARLVLKPDFVLRNKFRVNLRAPSKQTQYIWIEQGLLKLSADIERSNELFDRVPTNMASLLDIAECMKNKLENFIDPEFLPGNRSMFGTEDDSILDSLVHWRRPRDLYPPETLLEVMGDSVSEADIGKGVLSSPALLSVFKVLVLKPVLIQRLFSVRYYNKDGIYRTRLCVSGEWCHLTIDDYLPCLPLDQPYFTRSPTGVLWPLLLEKSLAKSLRGYVQIRSCQIYQLFQVFTGCPSTEVELNFTSKKGVQKIEEYLAEGFLVYGWLNMEQRKDKPFLPECNHAYPLLRLEGRDRLVFRVEGADKAVQWEEVGDWFSKLFVTKYRNWNQSRIKGKFVWEEELGCTMSRWYYSFDVFEKTKVAITLAQEDNSIKWVSEQRPYLDVAVVVFQKNRTKGLELLSNSEFTIEKDHHLELVLESGSYTIIPKTTGCRMQFQRTAGKFGELDNLRGDLGLREELISAIKDIFSKYDLLLDRQLGFKELSLFCKDINMNFKQDDYEEILRKYVEPTKNSHYKGLSLQGFTRLWRDLIVRDGEDLMKKRLSLLGYNSRLECNKSRMFTLAFHSSQQLKVLIRNTMGTDFDLRSNVQMCQRGKRIKMPIDHVYVCVRQSNQIFSYSVVNESESSVRVTIDLTKSTSAAFSDGVGKAVHVIQKGESAFYFHMQREALSQLKFQKVEEYKVERV